MQKSKWLWVIPFIGLFWACDRSAIFEKYHDIPGKSWANNTPVTFELDMEDTTQSCNIILRFRYNSDYPYRNLFIFLNTQYPDGQTSLDTLEFYLTDDIGRPMGKCSSEMCDAKFEIRRNIQFPQKGTYIFKLYHDMRTPENALPGLTDIGMRVERAGSP